MLSIWFFVKFVYRYIDIFVEKYDCCGYSPLLVIIFKEMECFMTEETNIHRESRLAKLKTLQEKGYNPYPYFFSPNAQAAELQKKYEALENGVDTEDRYTIAGRAMAVRNSGMFIDVKDASGKIQAFCHKNHLSEEALERLKSLDVGDIVGISGYIRRTPRGELSIAAESFDIISKSLQPYNLTRTSLSKYCVGRPNFYNFLS